MGLSRGANMPINTTKKRPLEKQVINEHIDLNPANSLQKSNQVSSWSRDLIKQCAMAIDENDVNKLQYCMWTLNELSSPYGDYEQRLSSAFLHALFSKLTKTGNKYYQSLCTAASKTNSFHSMKKMVLKFQELSPWMTVGITGANGAILEALNNEQKVHILDFSNTFCTQWPTLFEALAMRAEHPPNLRLTAVDLRFNDEEGYSSEVMKEITLRLEKFARLMGVPFEFRAIQLSIDKLETSMLDIKENEALIVNSINSFDNPTHTQKLIEFYTAINPKITVVVEDEVEYSSNHFMDCFSETLRFYSMFYESLDCTLPRTSNERLMLERIAARKIVYALSCENETASPRVHWKLRMQSAGYTAKLFREEVVDDIQALLKRYKTGWNLHRGEIGLFLSWNEQNAITVSIWKLNK